MKVQFSLCKQEQLMSYRANGSLPHGWNVSKYTRGFTVRGSDSYIYLGCSIIYHLTLVESKRTVRISQFLWSTGKYALSARGCPSSRLFGD